MLRATKVFVLLLFAASSLLAQPSSKGNRKKHKNALKSAKEHLHYEEFNEAIPAIQDLLNQDPNSAYYNFWMGKCLYITYKKNQALPYFRTVNGINPDIDKEFHYYYGLTLHYNLEYDDAVSEYSKDLERYEAGSSEYIWVSNRISQCNYAKKLSKKKDADQVKIVNMGENINSEYSEHSPVISANDSVLIYTARRPESLGADAEKYFYDEDIYVSHRNGGSWGTGKNIDRPVNSKGHDATISLTADGKKMFLYRHKKAGGLYVTDFDSEGKKWKEPKAIKKPLNSKYFEASICQSADSSIMFFTSDRPGGYGGRDIYIVHREGKDSWSEPQNLGATINTPFDEDAPYLHPDGKTLYYSSNGPKSIGGFDIFVTEVDSGSASGWLPPLNMGAPVNTPDDDIYFVLSADGKNGYYSSGKEGGYGEKDIYHLKFPYYPYPRRFNIVELAGSIQDVQTLSSIPALVKLVDNATNEVLDSVYTGIDSSNYSFILEPERSYSLIVSAQGYAPTAEELNTPSLNDDDLFMEKNMFLEKPVSEEKIPTEVVIANPVFPEIQHIYYDFDQADLRNGSPQELDMVAQVLQQNDDLNLRILAHTDWFGSYKYNVKLSDRRASSALDYLVNEKGISADRILTDNFSENNPIASNDGNRGRQYNRRSEFQFEEAGAILFKSVRLRKGVEGIAVDNTSPKGQPGFDNPDGVNSFSTESSSPSNNEAVAANSNSDYSNPSYESSSTNENLAVADESPEAIKAMLSANNLHHIYFDFDKYNLRSQSKSELARVLEMLENFPSLQVEIYGHTDAFGSVKYNQKLSENRASKAYQYLQSHGVSQDQLILTGFSEMQPLDSNQNDRGRQNNRRVEFRLIQNGRVLVNSVP